MFKKIIEWTSHNKLATTLIFVLLLLALPRLGVSSLMSISGRKMTNFGYDSDMVQSAPFGLSASEATYDMPVSSTKMINPDTGFMPEPIDQVPPVQTSDRKMITQGYMSIQVENVSGTIETIKNQLNEVSGYIVSVNLARPEFGESATLSARVPSDKMDSFLSFVRGASVKVVSENLNGSDITDQFVDQQARLDQIIKEKAMLEAILAKAITVEDIMRVRPYIQQMQNEIDSIKGSLKYMEGASNMSLITLYMSTDELSLPMTETLAWRPAVIMKSAYRSLLGTLMKLGTVGIWLGVYSMLIIPAFTIVFIFYLAIKRKK